MGDFEDYELAKYFPKLFQFGLQWKEIIWEYVDDNNEEALFSEMPVLIKKVAGFISDSALRKHVNNLYTKDFLLLKKLLEDKSKEFQIKILENLIGQSEYFRGEVVIDFPTNKRQIKKFTNYCLTELNHNPDREDKIPDELVLSLSESFPLAFNKSIDELIGKFQYLKNVFELNLDGVNDPLTFEYNGSKEDLTDLFVSLNLNGFVKKQFNTTSEFKAIFSGRSKIKSIIWFGNVYELFWFIGTLKKGNMIRNKAKSTKKTRNCFEKESNILFTENELQHSNPPGRTDLLVNIINTQLKSGKSKKRLP
jgi:hypothetical protein